MLGIVAKILCGLLGLIVLIGTGLHILHTVPSDPHTPPDGALRLASYNAHYIVLLDHYKGAWSVDGWNARKRAMNQAFKALDADIIAFQEMESWQSASDGSVNLARDFLAEENPDYGVAASGDWREFPSTQPIFFRKDKLQVIDEGWFFFSDTPDEIYSRTFNGSFPAYCSWARFETADGDRFHVFNVHYEYRSMSNRRKSAALTSTRIAPVIAGGEPVFLMGDFNAMRGAKTLRILRDAGVTFLKSRGGTYHLNQGLHLFAAIDHIGYAGGAQPIDDAYVIQKQYDGVWPTDHHPVVADFTFQDLGS